MFSLRRLFWSSLSHWGRVGLPLNVPIPAESHSPGRSSEMSGLADSFCLQCIKLDFDFFTKDCNDHQDKRTTQEISWTPFIPEENCQFCQLLAHCIGSTETIHQPLQGSLRGVYTGHELQLQIDDEEYSRKLSFSIRLSSPLSTTGLKEVTQVSLSFDVNELRLWLEQCKKHKCLPRDHSDHPLPQDFRLIDVWKGCIVQPKEHVEYCALSYVWGTRDQPELTSANAFQSKSPNFLETFELPLPKTIVDAIALCRDIGCDYLWVDRLCIIQDDKESKRIQIRSMADIYSLSYLAIIATAGDDAEAGLAPYGKRNSSISYMLRTTPSGTFVASLSPQIAAHDISRSVWASRGWTLQEYALARRVIFFTGSYAFLRCEKGLRCEDFGLGFSDCFEEDRKWDLPVPPFYKRRPDSNRHYPNTFSQLLAHFVRRSLRFEHDILDAFTGILTRMEKFGERGEHGTGRHLWGLPSKQFGAALQWSTNMPWPSTERVGFPSWSWAGWTHTADSLPPRNGSFHDMYEGFDDRSTDISVLTCYTVDECRTINCLDEGSFERLLSYFNDKTMSCQPSTLVNFLDQLQRHFSPSPPNALATYVNNPIYSKEYLSLHVFLWVSCVILRVDQSPIGAPHSGSLDFPIRLTDGGRQIGSIRLKSEWRQCQPDDMHFFVSTTGLHPASSSCSDAVNLKFKIILIQPYNDQDLLVYKRIQVSHTAICYEDWALALPKSKFIALV
jgi:Heterokaryon incompatibility protein (HET)